MRVTKIRIQNFRLLKDTSIDVEANLSVLLGKNNCGKTSLLLILDRFLGKPASRPSFSFDDFNSEFRDYIRSRVEDPTKDAEALTASGISLKLFIEYGEADDLANIGNKVIMDLDPDNRTIVLAFEYHTTAEALVTLRADFDKYKADKGANAKDLFKYLKEHHETYFHGARKSVLFNAATGAEDDSKYTDLNKEQIRIDRIINFKWISARREVSNKDSDRALSSLSARVYKGFDSKNSNVPAVEDFKDQLVKTDDILSDVYEGIFKDVVDDIKKFGGIKQDDSIIKIVSSLQHRELLEQNTTVMYGIGASTQLLPESYNGLGYMSLISMIFEIKIALHDFARERDDSAADINILFIEEPEVHTHPQMQCVFIKNIKSLLRKGVKDAQGSDKCLQTIITTHSSHIVAESDFQDIKYFKRSGNGINSKNLKDLEQQYVGFEDYYKFLRQYLTLHRSDLFFADKAIFIEGDTERILLPAMMKKLDYEDTATAFETGQEESALPLLAQNVSIIEVGAYSQIFDKFIDFIGIKSLVITDLDSIKTVPDLDEHQQQKTNDDGSPKFKTEMCPVADGNASSNYSLRFFVGKKTLAEFIALTPEQKLLKKDPATQKWIAAPDGHLRFSFQTAEVVEGQTYHARSFEDAFFHRNRKFMKENTFDESRVFIGAIRFPSLTQYRMKEFAEDRDGPYEFANKGIESKPSFAMEILLNSNHKTQKIHNTVNGADKDMIEEFENWAVPAYIKEGLQWLKQD